jgi:uncharacterized protein (TIGR03437 family)
LASDLQIGSGVMPSIRVLTGMMLLCRVIGAASVALPITFEEIDNQDLSGPTFLTRAPGYRVLLTSHEALLASREGQVIGISLAGSRDVAPKGLHLSAGRSNYLIGRDPAQWRTGIPNYEKVTYSQLYPGIDLVWHGGGGQIEHDFQVAAGANPGRIRLVLRGAALALNPEGDLTAGGYRFHKPHAFQDGREVECRYKVHGGTVRFALGSYDHGRPLTIDPVLSFSSFLGGSQNDSATGIALDHAGNMYITGTTTSWDFPTTPGVVEPIATRDLCPSIGTSVPCTEMFVTKLSGDGSTMLYSTYLGDNRPTAITVDSSGDVYLAASGGNAVPKLSPLPGQTVSANGSFVAKLNAIGSSIIYATALPQDVIASAIAVDAAGALYITGHTYYGDLPIVNAFQGTAADGLLFKTVDAGNHWQAFASGLTTDLTTGVTVDPTNPRVLYVLFEREVFKSTDGGATWQAIIGGTTPPVGPSSLVIDPQSPQTLYLGSANSQIGSVGVYKSTDGGATWVPSATGIGSSVRMLAIDPKNSSTIYAATYGGLSKSTDGAATWNPTGLTTTPWTIALDPSYSGTIYAATPSGVMKSIDGGTTWMTLTNGFTQSVDVLALAIDPINPQILYASTTITPGVFKSSDGGAHWTLEAWSLADTFVLNFLVDPVLDSRVWAGTNSGVIVSTDSGGTWAQTPSHFPHLSIDGMAADGHGGIYAVSFGLVAGDAFAMKLDSTGSQIVYSTYLGGIGAESGTGVAVDSAGRAYITGTTDSPDFPLAAAIQPQLTGNYDDFVTVLDPSGKSLVWSTYFGSGTFQSGPAVALDAAGNVHLAGTDGMYTFGAKLKGDGSAIVYSTHFGGSGLNFANGVATDAAGNTYITGGTSSPDIPTVNAVQPKFAGAQNAFIAEFNGQTGAVTYATYLGGSGTDAANAIAADAAGNVYIAGETESTDFPQLYALQLYGNCTPNVGGCYPGHAFVAKLAIAGNGPAIRLDALTNAASYGTTLAPGELFTIWGADMALTPAASVQPPLPTQVSNLAVTVNGVAAPLIYASAGQVNAQIPFEVQTGTAKVQVTSAAGTATKMVPIALTAPAIFTLNEEGTGPGAIQHASSYAVVTDSNPAAQGEAISIYCTGLGAVNPPAQTGAAPPATPSQTVVPVQVSIGGVGAQVTYAGVAPGYAGLYQVNAVIPPGASSGSQTVQILQGGAASNVVTIAVQ